jgi:hypothetical protein
LVIEPAAARIAALTKRRAVSDEYKKSQNAVLSAPFCGLRVFKQVPYLPDLRGFRTGENVASASLETGAPISPGKCAGVFPRDGKFLPIETGTKLLRALPPGITAEEPGAPDASRQPGPNRGFTLL